VWRQAGASLVAASHPTILRVPSTALSTFKPNHFRRPSNGRRGHPTRIPTVAAPVHQRKCGEHIGTLLSLP